MKNIHKCYHCNNQITNQTISFEDKQFCSNSCKEIYKILNHQELISFYNKTRNQELNIKSCTEYSNSDYDSLAFLEEFASSKDKKIYECFFLIENITCAACVWLNENILLKQDGILKANINMANKSAKITWDNTKIKVSKIINTISSIGYIAKPYSSQKANEDIKKEKKSIMIKIWVGLFASMNIMMIDVAKYGGSGLSITKDTSEIFHITELILCIIVILYSGVFFFKKAYGGIKHKIVNMEFLISFGVFLEFFYSLWVMYSKDGQTYFDSIIMIITFILIGKYIEASSKHKSMSSILSLQDIPTMANVKQEDKIIQKLAKLVQIGEIVQLKNTSNKAIIDGVIISGDGEFDISSTNGESLPVYKKKGDNIISGYKLINGEVLYKATNTYKNSFLTKLANTLQESLLTKHNYQDNIAVIANYFGIFVILTSIATFLGYFFIGGDFHYSLFIAISVVIISCPCALALSVPIAIMVALDLLLNKKIICKNPNTLEAINKSDYIVFDKTNTITKGFFSVVKSKYYIDIDLDLLYKAIEKSNHPIVNAVLEFLAKNKQDTSFLKHTEQILSRGVISKVQKDNQIFTIIAGSVEHLKSNNIDVPDFQSSHMSVFAFAINDKFGGYFLLEDIIKDEAKYVVNALKKQNKKILLLSGDTDESVKKIGDLLDIEYMANKSTNQKEQIIKDLQKNHKVLMVGDGLNDAKALNQSDISMSFFDCDNITQTSSDILLGEKNLKHILYTIKIANISSRLIKQNLFMSFLYNIIVIPLAIGGYMHPLVAAISMSISSLVVVFNSLRIKYFTKNKENYV